jgi:hypothetical protein
MRRAVLQFPDALSSIYQRIFACGSQVRLLKLNLTQD